MGCPIAPSPTMATLTVSPSRRAGVGEHRHRIPWYTFQAIRLHGQLSWSQAERKGIWWSM